MARGKKSGPSRLELRRQSEAAEAREEEDEELEDEEASEDDADAEGESDSDEGGDEDEAPKPKAKKPVKKKATPTKRTRAVKEVRMRAVWKVFDNSNKVIDTFPYNQKADAEELLAKKIEEKKGTFYLLMVKEQMEAGA